MRRGALRQMEAGLQIDRERLLQHFRRHLVDRRPGIDAGIVDDDVEPAEARRCRLDDAKDGRAIADIEDKGARLAARRGDLPGNALRRLAAAIGDRNGGSRESEEPGDGGTDAASRAGDQRDLAVEAKGGDLRHSAPPLSSARKVEKTSSWRAMSSGSEAGQSSSIVWKGVINTPRFMK